MVSWLILVGWIVGDEGSRRGPDFGIDEDSTVGGADEDGPELCGGESSAGEFPDEWGFVLPSWGDGSDGTSFGGGDGGFGVSVSVAVAEDDGCGWGVVVVVVACDDGSVGCLDAPGILVVLDESGFDVLVDGETFLFAVPVDDDSLFACGGGGFLEADGGSRGDGEHLQLVDECLVFGCGEGYEVIAVGLCGDSLEQVVEPVVVVSVAEPFVEQERVQVLSGCGLLDVLGDPVGFGGVIGVDGGGVLVEGGVDGFEYLAGGFGCFFDLDADGVGVSGFVGCWG